MTLIKNDLFKKSTNIKHLFSYIKRTNNLAVVPTDDKHIKKIKFIKNLF